MRIAFLPCPSHIFHYLSYQKIASCPPKLDSITPLKSIGISLIDLLMDRHTSQRIKGALCLKNYFSDMVAFIERRLVHGVLEKAHKQGIATVALGNRLIKF